jgi:hypothetical protein
MAKPTNLSIQANWILDLTTHLRGLEFVSINLSQEGHLFVLTAKHLLDYRNGNFAKAHPETPNDFVVIEFVNGTLSSTTEIPQQFWNYHFVQPLPDEELLLVCARVRGEANNARVFGTDGDFIRDFTLGDGIEHLQTTSDGQIWAAYFDEGVYGGETPISQSGLNRFDKFGNLAYSYQAPGGIGPIDDCYALNVASNDEIWCCYYSDFPLIQMGRQMIRNVWECPVHGSDGFTVWKNFAFSRGAYKKRNTYQLLGIIPNQSIKVFATIELLDKEGGKLEALWVRTRGSKMLLMDERLQCYEIELQDVVASYHKN